MTRERARDFGFAPAHDAPIPYLPRIREYYQALGYGAPYEWAHYADVPFRPLGKPLSRSRVAIVTTAAPYQPGKGDQGPRAPYNARPSSTTSIRATARRTPICASRTWPSTASTPRPRTSGTYFPLAELRRRAASGRIGSVAPRFHGAPTNRSHRVTLEVDCPEIVARCQADGVDAAILVPNCPVCHQTVSLAARMLEENGISTVVMGCAKDIVEYVGVPRFCSPIFPLGNAAGRPNDPASQAFTLDLALSLLESAPAARTTVQSPLRWSASPDWKLDYCNIERLTPEEIVRRRAEFDKGRRRPRACARTSALAAPMPRMRLPEELLIGQREATLYATIRASVVPVRSAAGR